MEVGGLDEVVFVELRAVVTVVGAWTSVDEDVRLVLLMLRLMVVAGPVACVVGDGGTDDEWCAVLLQPAAAKSTAHPSTVHRSMTAHRRRGTGR